MITPIARIIPGDDRLQRIRGQVVRIREDEFIVRDRTGQVWVDADLGDNRRLNLRVGETVTVVGDLDDGDFDARRITRANGQIVLNRLGAQPPIPNIPPNAVNSPNPATPPRTITNIADLIRRDGFRQTITGEIVGFRSNEELILRDATGSVEVELASGGALPRGLQVGDRLIVVGELDDIDFDAVQILPINRQADVLQGTARNNTLYGGAGNDQLLGRGGQDVLVGGAGNDGLYGGDGNDNLLGQAGNDTLIGGAGDDTLIGGVGRDLMNGGGGRDRFVYQSILCAGDRITGFNAAQDQLDFRQLVSGTGTWGDYVRAVQQGSQTVVSLDLDGTGSGFGFRAMATLANTSATTLNATNVLV